MYDYFGIVKASNPIYDSKPSDFFDIRFAGIF